MLTPNDPVEAAVLRQFFRESGYTESGLESALGGSHPPSPQLRTAARLLYLTREPAPLGLLARWFLLGGAIPAALAHGNVPKPVLDACLRSGLLVLDGDVLRATAVIAAHGELLVASDSFQQLASPDGRDHVLGLNLTAKYLLDFTIRRPAGDFLDLCSGSGIQGLVAARQAERVICTDLSARAVAFAAFNARLNGLENVSCTAGDRFAAVAGRRFDHIVCNPPFVLAPSAEFVFRDNPLPLDAFVAGLAREAPGHLNLGGHFQMICEWVEVEGESWQARLGRWFEGNGCDVWVLKDYTRDPSLYAQMRLRETLAASEAHDEETFRRWMDYYAAHRVAAVHGGLVAMRRRDGTNWLRIDEIAQSYGKNLGVAILAGFEARDFLAAHEDDEALLDTRPTLAPDCRLHQEHRRADDGWEPQPFRLEQRDGLRRGLNLDPSVAMFLGRFDGGRTVREALAELAAAADAQPAEVRTEVLQVIRRMIDLGFLLAPST
jgi:methylase of polypeptide subunit release factors